MPVLVHFIGYHVAGGAGAGADGDVGVFGDGYLGLVRYGRG